MARKDDIRTDGRAIPLTHHSARGKVQRNSGNFTRGSQLITHVSTAEQKSAIRRRKTRPRCYMPGGVA